MGPGFWTCELTARKDGMMAPYLGQFRDAFHGSLPQDNPHGGTEERFSCSLNDSESSIRGRDTPGAPELKNSCLSVVIVDGKR